MRFRLTEEEEKFQQEVGQWCEENVPAQLRERPILGNHYTLGAGAVSDITDADYQLIKQFTLKLGEKGWLRIGWPEEYGGTRMSPLERSIISEELGRHRGWHIRMADLPGMIIAHGTKEQKDYWLPPLGRGEIATCLVLSEPDAGSDMANCKCRAVLDGDHFVVNGMKHYVSQAQRADYGQLLVITDPEARKRHGLSRFICDMHAPGVTVRPMLDMAGEVELNEVWFDDVRIPKDWLIGTLNEWRFDFIGFPLTCIIKYEMQHANRVLMRLLIPEAIVNLLFWCVVSSFLIIITSLLNKGILRMNKIGGDFK